ncbi:MAG: sulfite exporter TauE/SafE family protein [Thiothrix sp.]
MEYLLLAVASIFASALTGTVGVGGALLIVPALTATADLFGLLPAEIRFIGYTMNFISLAPIVYKNRQQIDWKIARLLTVTAMTGAVIGANIPQFASQKTLSLGLVATLVLAILLLIRKLGDKTPAKPDFPHTQRGWISIMLIGGIVGLASGLFGIGGGIFMLPLISLLLGVKPKNIVLLTPVIVLFSTGTGILTSLWHGATFSNAALAVIAVLGAVIGAEWGDKLRGTLPDKALNLLMIGLLSLLAVRIFIQTI